MPSRPASICPCGYRVPFGTRCQCQQKRDQERKARHDAKRPSASQRGYDANWQREAKAYLRLNPTCRRCGQPSTLVDHIQPHKGIRALFWNRANWQPLCTRCHSSAKQAVERGNRGTVDNFRGARLTGGGSVARDFPEKRFQPSGSGRTAR